MAYNALSQNADKQNVGQKFSPKENLGRSLKFILTNTDFSFATQTLAETQSEWQNAIEQVSGRIYPMPYILENEDNSEESVMQDFTGGDSLLVRKGKYAERVKIHVSVSDMIKLSSFNNKNFRCAVVDSNGNILGTSSDGTIFQGFELTTFEVEKMNMTIGDVNRLVPIYIKFKDPTEWTEKGVALRPLDLDTDSWDPRDLDGLTDVELTVNTASSTNINVTATAYLKGEVLSGFDQVGDWILATGQTITGVTDNDDGTYDLAGTGLVTGTIDLAASADLSQDGYESTGSQTVTI